MKRRSIAMGMALAWLGCEGPTGGGETTETVQAEPQLAIDLQAGHYGMVTLGARSALAFTLSNVGSGATGALDVTVVGGFEIDRNDCAVLDPSRACRVVVAFAPSSAGEAHGTLIVDAVPGGRLEVALDGEGVGPGTLSVSTTTSDLGTVAVGATGTTVATVTIGNDGASEIGPIAVQPGGTDPAHFERRSDGCAHEVLAPGARCAIEIAFMPRSAGDKSALFTISAPSGERVSAAVNGVGAIPAMLGLSPGRQSFGSVARGSASEIAFSIVNLGQLPSGPIAVSLKGDVGFRAVRCDGVSLAGGESCEIRVGFTPESVGAMTAVLTVAGPNTVTANLGGTGVETQLRVSPTASTFDPTAVGAFSATRSFRVMNMGPRASGEITVALERAVGGTFEKVRGAGDCVGTSLAPRASCTLDYVFTPGVAGPASAELVITSPGSGSATVGISGVGLMPAALTLTPADQDFGSVPVGESATQAFLLTNVGGLRSERVTTTIVGDDGYRIVSNPCTRLAPGRSCTIHVRFAPNAIAASVATLTVEAGGQHQSAALSGEGIDPDQLTITPTPYTFAPTALGDRIVQTFTVTDDSDAATGPLRVAVEGRVAGDYEVSHDCDALSAHESCTVTVAFAPTSFGARDSRLVVRASPGGIVSAALAGIGRPRLEVVDASGTVALAPVDFGDVVIGTTAPAAREILVRNNTTATVPFSVATTFGDPAQFSLASDCDVIDAGETCAVTVRFTPTVRGTRNGAITFAIGEGPGDRVVQALTGAGIDALTITALTGNAFGDVPMNTASHSRTFTVTNPIDARTTGALAVRLSGAGFRLDNDQCTGTVLAPSGTCAFDVTFAPVMRGASAGTVSVSSDPGGTSKITVGARAVAPSGSAPTQIVLAPSSVLENAPAATVVGTLSAVDADLDDTFGFTIVSSDGFALDGDTIVTTRAFDREALASQPVRVRVVDAGGHAYVQALFVAISDIDEPATLADDVAMTHEDVPVRIDVLANDIDLDSVLAVTAVTQGARGVVSVNGTAVLYAPIADACGADTFTYQIAEGASATVNVVIDCIDDPTVPAADSATVTQGDPARMIDVLANDSDVDGDKRIVAVTQPAEGTVVIDGAQVAFTVAANPTLAEVSFMYTVASGESALVTVTVIILDDAPTAVVDVFSLDEDAAASFVDVLANDVDPDGGPKLIQSFTQPGNGVVVRVGSDLTYQPVADFNGTDSFTYTLNGGSTTTATVTVSPIDDYPTARDDSASVAEDASATAIDVRVNDVDGDGGDMTIVAVTQPANGTVTLTVSGLAYAPAADFVGTDSFTYSLIGGSVGSVTVTVSAVDDGPVAVTDDLTVSEDSSATTIDVIANDTDVDGGTKTITGFTQGASGTVAASSGNLTYVPAANFVGTDVFTYTLNGGSTTSVVVTVTPVDDAPVAVADSAVVAEDASATSIDVLANDSDIDDGPKQIAAVTQPGSGVVVMTSTSLTYAPSAGFNGTDTFTYTLDGGSTTTVTVVVSAVDDAPSAVADAITIDEDAGATPIDVLANDSDEDGGVKSIVSVTQGTLGVVTLANNAIGYTPNANANGTDTFTYTLAGGSAGTVTVTIGAVNDAPVIVGGASAAYTVAVGGVAVATIVASDVDGPGIVWSLRGDDAALFTIGASTGVLELATAAVFDPQADNVYDLIVDASDGTTVSQAVTVTITTSGPEAKIDILRTSYDGETMLHGMLTIDDPSAIGDVSVRLEVEDGKITVALGQITTNEVAITDNGSKNVLLTGELAVLQSLLAGERGATIKFEEGSLLTPLTLTLIGSTTVSDTALVSGPYIEAPYNLVLLPGESRVYDVRLYDRLGELEATRPVVAGVGAIGSYDATTGVITAGMVSNVATMVTVSAPDRPSLTVAFAVRSYTTVTTSTDLQANIAQSDEFSAFGSNNYQPSTSYYADIYAVSLTVGQTIVVTLDTGDDLDTYLVVADGATGNPLAVNDDDDDGVLGVGSRVVFTAPSSGVFLIEASTFNGLDTGSYRFQVQTEM